MTEGTLAGLRVILVEDEFLIAMEIADALAATGAVVSGPHATLDQALAAAEAETADIAILDIDLKGEEVFPAASVLRERGIPFLFYTGRADRETLRSTFSEVPVCIKPLDTKRLLEAARKLLPLAA